MTSLLRGSLKGTNAAMMTRIEEIGMRTYMKKKILASVIGVKLHDSRPGEMNQEVGTSHLPEEDEKKDTRKGGEVLQREDGKRVGKEVDPDQLEATEEARPRMRPYVMGPGPLGSANPT